MRFTLVFRQTGKIHRRMYYSFSLYNILLYYPSDERVPSMNINLKLLQSYSSILKVKVTAFVQISTKDRVVGVIVLGYFRNKDFSKQINRLKIKNIY